MSEPGDSGSEDGSNDDLVIVKEDFEVTKVIASHPSMYFIALGGWVFAYQVVWAQKGARASRAQWVTVEDVEKCAELVAEFHAANPTAPWPPGGGPGAVGAPPGEGATGAAP